MPYPTNHQLAGLPHSMISAGILLAVAVAASHRATVRWDGCRYPAVEEAKEIVRELAYEAYPMWSDAHPDHGCPDRLDDLLEYMCPTHRKDPWGNAYRFYCGHDVPAGAHGVAAISVGEDGEARTSDDIRSWE
jgi:hypothetical protein